MSSGEEDPPEAAAAKAKAEKEAVKEAVEEVLNGIPAFRQWVSSWRNGGGEKGKGVALPAGGGKSGPEGASTSTGDCDLPRDSLGRLGS